MSDLITCEDGKTRCGHRIDDPYFRSYHDTVFGRPTSNDRVIFRKICIEIFASGLSFHGMLAKMEAMDDAYANFEIYRVAAFGESEKERLLSDKSLVRNERKVDAVISNAVAVQEITSEFGSLAAFVWQYEPDPETRPKKVTHDTVAEITQSEYSERLASDLKKHGLTFVGPVSMYGVLQGCGLINDHFHGCDFREICEKERKAFEVPMPKQ